MPTKVRLRGRPKGQMTQNRRKVLAAYLDALASGERVSTSRIARRCGLHSYRDAKRTINDLKRYGMV